MLQAGAILFRTLICFLLLHVAPLWAEESEPEDHIVSRSVFRDKSAQLQVADLNPANFSPVTGIFAGGYTRDAIWMKLVVRPHAGHGPLQLRIRPAYLNHLTLYVPDPVTSGWKTQTSGNAMPWKDRPYPAMTLGFTIHPVEPTTYYLRLTTLSNTQLSVEAIDATTAAKAEIQFFLWQGFYLALLLWIIFWAINDFLLSRDHLILIFATVHGVFLVYVLALMGFISLLLPTSSHIPILSFWSVTLAVFSSLIFHRSLLLAVQINRIARWSLNGMLTVSGVAIGLLLSGQTANALQLNSLLALFSAPVLLISALTAQGDALLSKNTIRFFYGLLSIYVVFYILPILGILSGNFWSLYGALLQGIVSASLFGIMLHRRTCRLIEQEAQAQLQLTLSAQQLGQQQLQLAEQSRFMAMLTHELKNPLAAIRLTLNTLTRGQDPLSDKRQHRIDQALNDIDALVERCALSDRIEHGQNIVPQRVPVDITGLVSDVVKRYMPGGRLNIVAPGDTVTVSSDPQLLATAIGNLVENALKYSPADSPVEVRIRRADGPGESTGLPGVMVDVLNQPWQAGFPDAERAFDKYHRGERAFHRGGSGLGLYLVKGIAGQLGGDVSYRKRDERIQFSLWIPETPP